MLRMFLCLSQVGVVSVLHDMCRLGDGKLLCSLVNTIHPGAISAMVTD